MFWTFFLSIFYLCLDSTRNSCRSYHELWNVQSLGINSLEKTWQWSHLFQNCPPSSRNANAQTTSLSRYRQKWEREQRCLESITSQGTNGDDQHLSVDPRLCACSVDSTKRLALGRQVHKLHRRNDWNHVELHRTLPVFCQKKTCQDSVKLSFFTFIPLLKCLRIEWAAWS